MCPLDQFAKCAQSVKFVSVVTSGRVALASQFGLSFIDPSSVSSEVVILAFGVEERIRSLVGMGKD